MNYWLFKTEPGTYSFETLLREKKTNWDHVRNFQARNTLRLCQKSDYVLIYHSGDERAVVGVAQVTKEAYPDLDPEKKGDWVQVDLKSKLALTGSVSLKQLKATPALANLQLIKQSRLSCMQVTLAEFQTILKLGNTWDAFQKLK
ncbi:MAG: EVE domain-containing protein [Bdellovibrionales bacterium]|nr:EVE domain-containing protein [Oligoflexia bacterium]